MNSNVDENLKTEIEKNLGQFGEIYIPSKIKLKSKDLFGLEKQKSLLNSFFNVLKHYSEDIPYNDSSLWDKYWESKTDLFPIPIILSSLLVGPPGTGKTTLAKAFAKEFNFPIIVVFSNALIGSLLGESLNRVKNLLHQAETYAKKKGPIILFFDEIDAISGERSNMSDVGEIKRMVISFLQELDLLLEKNLPIGIIGATNHPEQLDKAVWRRFTFKIDFPIPSDSVRMELINNFLKKIKNHPKFEVKFDNKDVTLETIRLLTNSLTGADIERAFQIAILQCFNKEQGTGANIYTIDTNILIGAFKSVININLDVNEGSEENKADKSYSGSSSTEVSD